MGRTLRQIALDRGFLVVIAALIVYVVLAPPHIADGDNAEFATLGTIGGVAHPSGYPLYLIWLRLTAWLPGETPAHTAAISTAILAVIQLAVLHAACRAWGARPRAASFAVAIYAAGPVVLRMYTEAEVFALNGLCVAVVLWLAALGGPLRGTWRLAALGLVAGLGLSNHLTCVLVAPVGILGVVRGVRETTLAKPVALALPIAGLVVGLTPYLYLMVTRDTLISWGEIDGFDRLVHHFLRKDYGAVDQFSPKGRDVAVTQSLWAFAETLLRGWLWVGALGGLAMFARLVVRPVAPETRWSWGLLALSFVIAGPVLASRFNVVPEGVGLYIVQRFHLLPLLLLALPISLGFDQVARWIEPRTSTRLLRSAIALEVGAVVVLLALVGTSLSQVARFHSPAIERGLANTLRSVPRDAVIIGSTDVFHFGMGYLQAVRGERPDVTNIAWPQVPSPAYRRRLAARTGIVIEPNEKTGIQSVDVATTILATGRPLFIDAWGANIARSFQTYPFGVLFRVLPPGESPPPIEEVFTMNRQLFEGFTFDYEVPGPDDQFATELHELYERLWVIIGTASRKAGHAENAAVADAFAAALRPRE